MSDFDRAKCAQRNRLAARRDGVEAPTFHFLRGAPDPTAAVGLRYAYGSLPATDLLALALINERLPPDSPPLQLDDIYIHYVEAANNNYIGARDPRPMFLGDTTLRNVAADAATPPGIAFMNSHRNGGMSHPAELPLGKTFAGRYEEYADGTKRAVVAFYMLKRVFPNGPSSPGTDDLHAGIAGGTVFDVSVGLGGGEKVCDVCGNEVNSTREEEDADGYRRRVRLCTHVPGTTHKMTKPEQAAQQARGVAKGTASYTLHNAHCGEVSAVYDGAVPGAGFTKALALARDLTPVERLQARAAYATLLRKGDFDMDEISEAVAGGFERALLRLGLRREPEPDPGNTIQFTPVASQSAGSGETGPSPREIELEARLATEQAALAAERTARAQAEATQRERDAATFAETLVTSGRIDPAARPQWQAAYTQALADDTERPLTLAYQDALDVAHTGTRAEVLGAAAGLLPARRFGDHIPVAHLQAVPATGPTPYATEYDATAAYARQQNAKEKHTK